MSLDRNTKAQLDALIDKFDERIESAIDKREIEAKKNSLFSNSNSKPSLLSKGTLDGMQRVFKDGLHSFDFEIKAGDITESSGSGDYTLVDYGGNRPSFRSYFNMMSLLPNYNVGGSSVRFVTENSEDNQFAIVAEAGASAQGDVQFKEVKKSLETVRQYGVISQELLDDGENLEQFVRNRFVQQLINKMNNELINGTGNISSLNGNKVDCPTDGTLIFADSVDNATNLDVLKAVIGQQQNSGFTVDLMVISPKEMFNLQFLKDTTNQYVQGGLQVIAPNHCRYGGVDIYSTEVLTGDKGFALDSQKYGTVVSKNTFDAKLSREGKNSLIYNVAYLSMSSRINMAVFNANANMMFDFSDVKSALETP